MGSLKDIAHSHGGSEHFFREKKILFIGSESHDAPTITILQGLQKLGFTIYTIKKWNINSWFCNVVVNDLSSIKFDFVLSNLHWGTRWQYYDTYQLGSYLKVLIDGDDNRNWSTWRDKYNAYRTEYVFEPPEEIKNREVSDFRWLEDLGGYSPDVVFTSQKQIGDQATLFLPFGILDEYFSLCEHKSGSQRSIDWAHINGPGSKRAMTRRILSFTKAIGILPGTLFNSFAHGKKEIAPDIEPFYAKEQSENSIVHAYFRWSLDRAYFNVLNNSKVLIYPGVGHLPFWDSKRPWEAYASNCLVMLSQPNIDVSQYSPLDICEFANYSSPVELLDKCRFLHRNSGELDKLRVLASTRASEYFSSTALARYFLGSIRQTM